MKNFILGFVVALMIVSSFMVVSNVFARKQYPGDGTLGNYKVEMSEDGNYAIRLNTHTGQVWATGLSRDVRKCTWFKIKEWKS